LRLSLAVSILHVLSLPLLVTFDGYWYARLADILGTSQFPAQWDYLRTPLFPILLRLSFWIFGRQALAVSVLQTTFGLTGIWLLGATLKGLGRVREAAVLVLLLSFYSTLVTYEHALLTESGTFFFLAAVLYTLTKSWEEPTWRALALACLLALGYYHRSTLLYIAPVVALVYAVTLGRQGAWSAVVNRHDQRRASLSVLIVGLLPFLLAFPWQVNPRVSQRTGQSVLLYGLVKQGVFPPDDEIWGSAAPVYANAIRQSSVNGSLPLTGVQDQLVYPPLDAIYSHGSEAGRIFAKEIAAHPWSYFHAVGRTLLLYSGVAAPETDSGTFRAFVLTRPEATIAARPDGFPALDVELAQKVGTSIMGRFLQLIGPLYDTLLFAAAVTTVLVLVIGTYRRDATQIAFAGIPIAYLLLNALVLNSQDRMAVPTYPLLFANLVLFPGWMRPRRKAEPAEADRYFHSLDRRAFFLLLLFIVVITTCHLVYVLRSQMIPSSDEAQYMSGVLSIGRAMQSHSLTAIVQSFRTALGFKAPMICVPAAVLYQIVRDVFTASKLSLIAIFICMGLAAYSLFRNLYRPTLAAFATALLITSPVITGVTHRLYVEGFLLLNIIVYLDLLIRYRIDRFRCAAGLGLVCGVGLLVKVLFLPLILLPTLYVAWLSYAACVPRLGRARSAIMPTARLAALGAIAGTIAWFWYGYAQHWRVVLDTAGSSVQCLECSYPVVRACLVNASSGPYFFVFVLSLIGLFRLATCATSGMVSSRELQPWVVILLSAVVIPTVNVIGTNKSVRYFVVVLPAVSSLAVFAARAWFENGRRLLGFLLALTVCSTVLVLHNSFGVLPFRSIRLGDLRLLDCCYPLNPPGWFDDNHPLDQRNFRVSEADALFAHDIRGHRPPGWEGRAGLLVHGLLINHDYLNLLAQINREPLQYNPFYLTEINGESAPDYILTCAGCGNVYPGRHWFDPHPDFLDQAKSGKMAYEEIFELAAPANCTLFGFRKRQLLQQKLTLPKGLRLLVGTTQIFVDRVNMTHSPSASDTVAVDRRWPLHIVGWAVDAPNKDVAGGVYIDIDGQTYQARYGIARPDVASALQNPRYSTSGFDAELPIGDLEPGPHAIALRVMNAQRTGLYQGRTIEISIQ
jgi:hypothetical protein